MQNRHGIYAEWKPKCSQDDNTIDIFVAKFRSIRRFRQKYLHRISQLRQFDFSAPISYPLPDAHVLTVDDLINLLHRQNYSDLNWQDRIKVEMGRVNVLNQRSGTSFRPINCPPLHLCEKPSDSILKWDGIPRRTANLLAETSR